IALLYLLVFTHAPTTDLSTLSLHDALPIFGGAEIELGSRPELERYAGTTIGLGIRPEHVREAGDDSGGARLRGEALLVEALGARSEEHTSELQSRFDLVCRLLLEKKKTRKGNAKMHLASKNERGEMHKETHKEVVGVRAVTSRQHTNGPVYAVHGMRADDAKSTDA